MSASDRHELKPTSPTHRPHQRFVAVGNDLIRQAQSATSCRGFEPVSVNHPPRVTAHRIARERGNAVSQLGGVVAESALIVSAADTRITRATDTPDKSERCKASA